MIGLSNPTNQLLKVYLNDTDSLNQLATVSFYYLNSPCKMVDTDADHLGMRLDLLKKVNYSCRAGVRSFFRKIIHRRRKAFTDYFFSACETKYKKLNLQNWDKFLDEFSRLKYPEEDKQGKKKPKRSQKTAVDFVITENIIIRMYHFFERHRIVAMMLIIILVIMLEQFDLIPDAIKNFLVDVTHSFLG